MSPFDLKGAWETGVSEMFRTCLNDVPAGFFQIDCEGKLLNFNKRAAEIFGFGNLEEGIGKPLSQLEFFFSTVVTERILNLLKNNDAFKIKCFPGTNLRGHFAYYCLACAGTQCENGMPTGVFGVIEDVSDHVQRQQDLKCRIDELSILSQISQVVSSALDTEEVIKVILTGVTARQGLGFNRAFLFLLDDESRFLNGRLAIGPADAEEAGNIWTSLEKDERSLFEILSLYQEKSQRHQQTLTDLVQGIRIDVTNGSFFARVINEKTPLVIERDIELDQLTETILTRLGEKEVAMTPLVSRGRPLGLLMVDNAITHQEITEDDRMFLKLIADQTAAALERSYLYQDIKERALELQDINRKLAETQNQIIETEKMSVIGEITSAVAHELRNPLTVIGGFANMVYRNLGPASSDGEYLNIIISETQRAEAVLTDVLDFSKASKEKDGRLDLYELARKAVDMLTVRMGNGRCRLQLEEQKAALPIWGNREQLLHALYQILWSLVEDLPEQVPNLCVFGTDDIVRLEIHLPDKKNAEKTEKTIRQYFSGSRSTRRLSLIVAEETLKHHGGNLGVESNPEMGPVLFVELPRNKEIPDGQVISG